MTRFGWIVATVLGAALAVVAGAGILKASDTYLTGPLVVRTDDGTAATCESSDGAGDVCVGSDLRADSNAVIGGTLSVTGASTLTGAATFTGDLTLNGGAGALTCGDGDCSLVLNDNDGTGFVAGSTGLLNLLTLDTTDSAEKLLVTGSSAGTKSFHVDTGTADFDENPTLVDGVYGTVKTTLTNSELKNVRGTPITLVSAVAGDLIVVDQITAELNAGSEVLTESADNLAIEYSDGQDIDVIESTGFIDQSADTFAVLYPADLTNQASASVGVGNAVQIFNNGDGEFAGNASNDATLDVWVSYRVLDF